MSLTACPECSRQISTAAFSCPGCGHPAQAAAFVPLRRRRIDWLVPAIAAGGLLTSLIGVQVMRTAFHAFQGAGAHAHPPRVEVVHAIEVHRMEHPLPPPPIVDFAIERSVVEAFEMREMGELPRIRNARDVSRMVSRVYPPALREAGVPGHVVARFQVTEEGLVDPATIDIEAATHSAFGDPARMVVQRMRFEPALVDGHPVSTWMTVPITFALPR